MTTTTDRIVQLTSDDGAVDASDDCTCLPPWTEWGDDLHPLSISARRRGDLWVVQKMGVYLDTDVVMSKIAHVIDYHDEGLASIRVNLQLNR